MKYIIVLLLFMFGAQSAAFADGFMEWQSTNVQLLRGNSYELGDESRTIMTIEHAHGWKYGDTYGFLDTIVPDDGQTTYYFEFAPRVSLSKVFDTSLSFGPVKDVLIATTLEKPRGQGPRYLYGVGVDLNLPGFKFFKANGYVRDDTQLQDETWQVTLAWNRPFKIGNVNMLLEGFADIAGGEGPTKTENQLIVPRLLMDIGSITGFRPGKIWAGVEYSYWHNKFGNDGVTESVPQAQAKWVF